MQLWRPRVSCAVLCPPAASNDCGSVLAVSVSEAVDSSVSEQGAGHQGPAEAGTVPLGLVAAPPAPSLTTVTASSPSLPRTGEFRSRRRPSSSPRPVLSRSGGPVTARPCPWWWPPPSPPSPATVTASSPGPSSNVASVECG